MRTDGKAPGGKRIFWLGMHVVLTKTELPRLRKLGYEVFNPPYISPIYDQSANLDWDAGQQTTLPADVFKTLSETNFFYTDFSPKIIDILNTYFDAIIVTITPIWLEPVLRHFRGPIIYRLYGQHGHLSSEIIDRNLWSRLVSHPNFHIVPFCDLVVEDEAPWFRSRCAASIPYSLPLDTFEHRDSWREHTHNQTIMVSVPNIHNPFFNTMYQHMNTVYPETFIRIYGVQRAEVGDPRVVGTVDRKMLLRHFQKAAGYFYSYQDWNVCYLPPIEMMTIGGPVLFAPDSLLHRFFGCDAPGLGRTPDEIRDKMQWLRQGDATFIDEVIASQTEVRKLYDPDYVDPQFDTVMKSLIDDTPPTPVPPISIRSGDVAVAGRGTSPQDPVICCLGHLSPTKAGLWSEAAHVEQIRHQLCRLVDTLLEETGCRVILTTYATDLPNLYSRYADPMADGRLTLHVVDHEKIDSGLDTEAQPDAVALMLGIVAKVDSTSTPATERLTDAMLRLRCLRRLDDDPAVAAIVVPGAGLFPEAMSSSKTLVAFLPQIVTMSPAMAAHQSGGQQTALLTARAALVLTDAESTVERLVQDFGLPPSHVAWIPLPEDDLPVDDSGEALSVRGFEMELGGAPFLYAPKSGVTLAGQSILLAAFSLLVETRPNARLVIGASSPSVEPAARQLASRLGVDGRVSWIAASDRKLSSWLFEKTAALCIGSGKDGEVSPEYERRVAAARLPTVRLPGADGDVDMVADALLAALDCRANGKAAQVPMVGASSPGSEGQPMTERSDGLLRLFQAMRLPTNAASRIEQAV